MSKKLFEDEYQKTLHSMSTEDLIENYKEIQFELDINTKDYPDFCDSFIESGTLNGYELSDKQIESLNNDSEFLYDLIIDNLF